MPKATRKVSIKSLNKRLSNPEVPAGWIPEAWEALYDAHKRGLAGYVIPDRATVWSMDRAGEWRPDGILQAIAEPRISGAPAARAPLALSPGCLRCGEPMDRNASEDTCSACVRELAAKARLSAMLARDHRPHVYAPHLSAVEVSP